ncbi:MAG: DMT family transporter [Mycobacteriales bacterium]
MRPRPRQLPWPARLVVLAAIWGMSFLFIKVSDEALAPLQVAFGRAACGAATLLCVLPASRTKLPRGVPVWAHLAVVALLFNAVPFTLFAYGEQRVSSVLAGIWNATTPLFTVPVALLVLSDERPSRARVAGLAIGFTGVLVVLHVWTGLGGSSLEGNLFCLGAAGCYGLGITYTRRFLSGRPDGPISLAAGQLACATVELGVVTVLRTGAPALLPGRVIASVVTLGVLGTGIAYVLSYTLIRDVGATVSSTVTYLIPVFSTLAGVLLLGERLTWNQPVGALVIAAGAAATQRHPPLGAAPAGPGRLDIPGGEPPAG